MRSLRFEEENPDDVTGGLFLLVVEVEMEREAHAKLSVRLGIDGRLARLLDAALGPARPVLRKFLLNFFARGIGAAKVINAVGKEAALRSRIGCAGRVEISGDKFFERSPAEFQGRIAGRSGRVVRSGWGRAVRVDARCG